MIVHDTLYIDNYLNEIELPIKRGSRVIISAPTGSGKTTRAINDKSHEHSIVLLPKIAIGLSKETSEHPFYYNGKMPLYQSHSNWYATYDNILKIEPEILSKSIVWIDEVHLLGVSSYRITLPRILTYILKYAKTVVGISGTLNIEIFENIFYEYIPIKKTSSREITINNVLCDNVDTVKFALQQTLAQIELGNKVLVLIENLTELRVFTENLRKFPIFSHKNSILKYVSEESRLTVSNRPEAINIICKGIIPKETLVICGTSAIVEGWDLHTNEIWNCVICGDKSYTNVIKTPEIAIQFSNRTRNNLPVIVYIQRNIPQNKNVNKPSLLSNNDIKNIIKSQREQARETYLTLGTTNERHVIELDGINAFSDIPLIELRQRNINRKHGFKVKCGTWLTAYEEHSHSHGVRNIIQSNFNNFKGKFPSFSNLESALFNVLIDNPHPFTVTEKQVDNFLNEKENSYLPESILMLISTCGKFQVKAKEEINKIMQILKCYGSSEAVNAIEKDISYNQLLTHAKKFISNGIERYEVKERLLDLFGDEFHNSEDVIIEFRKIPQTFFHGCTNKRIAISKKEIKTLLGGFLNYETKRHGKKNIKMVRLIKTPSTTISSNNKKHMITFNLAWVNKNIRQVIMNKLEKVKRKGNRIDQIKKLKNKYAYYVEFFDNLNE